MTSLTDSEVYSDDFLPVASREARLASRKLFSYHVRSIIAGIFVLVAFRRIFAPNVDAAGPPLLKTLGLMGFFYATFAGAFKTFDTLSREKREGTLGLLLLTDLKPFQILFGKLLAASAITVFGLLAFLPILSVPIIIGGVVFDQIIRLAFSMVVTLLLSMSWGLYVSAAARHYLSSLSGVTFLLLVFGFFPLASAASLNPLSESFTFEAVVFLFTPALPFQLAFTVNPDLTQFFWPSIICNLILALAWIAAATIILPGCCHEAPGESKLLQTLQNWVNAFRFGFPERRARLRQHLLEINPLLWLANRDGAYSPALTILCAAILLVARVFKVDQLGLLTASLAILFRMAYASAHSISEDQKNGALELLLSTTLAVPDILAGLNRAMRRRFFLPVALVILWPWFVGGVKFDRIFSNLLVCSSLLLIATWVALSWVGPWFALRRKPTSAAWTSLAVVVLPPWLIWIVSIFPGLFNPEYADIHSIGAVVCSIVGVVHCILVTRWARQILSQNFREAAADPFATIEFEPRFQAFVEPAKIKVVAVGHGHVHISRSGRSALLLAIPAENHVFVAWGGHARGLDNPVHLHLQGNALVVARFANVSD